MNTFWKFFKRFQGNYSSWTPKTIINMEGNLTTAPTDIAYTLAHTFASNSSNKNYTDEFLQYKITVKIQK